MNRLRTAGWLAAFAFLATVDAHPAAGQRVTGRLTDVASGQPVSFAVVELVDSAGNVVRRTQTSLAGVYVMPAPWDVPLRVRALAIGFGNTLSPLFTIHDTETHRADIALTVVEPFTLPEIGAGSERTCRINSSASSVLAVWTEARKALASAALAEQEGYLMFHGFTFSRRIDRDSMVLMQNTKPFTSVVTQPFVAPPIASLVADGYIQRRGNAYDYYAPNASVLLSPEFESTHCFSLVRNAEKPELVGVAFTPVRSANAVPGIAGTAWVDIRSSALQFVEFRYVNASSIRYSEEASGRVELRVVPGAGWVVGRWRIVTPAVAAETRFGGRTTGGTHITVFTHVGGELTAVTVGGALTALSAPGSITGTAYDSTRRAPLANATLALEGTGLTTRTDARGTFQLDNIQSGTYMLTLRHPRLDSLPAYPSVGQTITVGEGKTAFVATAIPPLARSVIGACTSRLAGDDERGIIFVPAFGVVRDSATGARVPGAKLNLSWQRVMGTSTTYRTAQENVETIADETGRFMVCNVPDERWIDIAVTKDSLRYAPLRKQTTREPTYWDIIVSRGVPVRVAAATSPGGSGAQGAGAQAAGAQGAAPGAAPGRVAPPAPAQGAAAKDSLPATAVELGAVEGTARPARPPVGGSFVGGFPVAKTMSRVAGDKMLRMETSGVGMYSVLKELAGIRIRNTRDGQCIETSRGRNSINQGGPCQSPALVIDGIVQLMGVSMLLTMPLSDIESIEYMNSAEIGVRFPNIPNGAIVIWTRGNGPHQSVARTNWK